MSDAIAPGFLAGLGAKIWVEDGCARARFEVQPRFFKPGTERVRVGVLATLVDVVAGAPEHAIVSPTVDLRISLLRPLPSAGIVEMVCRPLRIGQQLFVAETLVYGDDVTKPLARSVCTYLNRPIPEFDRHSLIPDGSLGAGSFDDLLPLREVGPGVYELVNAPNIRNPRHNTIQGGVQAFLSELTAERALLSHNGIEYEVFDLDIRYLNSLRTPAARAMAEVVPESPGGALVRVAIVESDNDERIVSLATVCCRPV